MNHRLVSQDCQDPATDFTVKGGVSSGVGAMGNLICLG